MMALFIVLWLLNSSQKVQKAVGGYFCDPSGTAETPGSDMNGVAENFVLTKDNMDEIKEQLEKTIREVPDFEKLKNNIDMTVTNEGLRIETHRIRQRHLLRQWQLENQHRRHRTPRRARW